MNYEVRECKHSRTRERDVRCYSASVAVEPYTTENPAAAGGITFVEECLDCGMEMAVNRNQRHVECGPWRIPQAVFDAREARRASDARRGAVARVILRLAVH